MKILSISRGNHELVRAHLVRPLVTIGRAPSCDVVLRAPQVAPVHFLFEWIGSGSFSPAVAEWSVSDVSGDAGDSGQGIVLPAQGGRVEFAGFTFAFVEDRLEPRPEIGGRIQKGLEEAAVAAPTQSSRAPTAGPSVRLAEVVQIRQDSGAVEEVVHLPLSRLRQGKPERPLRGVPEFALRMAPQATRDEVVQLIHQEMPGAEIWVGGAPLGAGRSETGGARIAQIERHEMIRVRWKERLFFVRCVESVPIPQLTKKPMERDLKTALKWTSVVFALVTLVVALGGGAPEKPEAPPRRIARIEVPAQEAPPAEAPVAPVAEQVAEASVEVPRAEVPAQAAAGAAAKPRFETAKDQPKRAGLNTPAPVSDVNSVGILAALKKGGAPGPGIKAEQIEVARQSSESISGGDAARVMLRNPPAGVLGSGSSGGGQSASGGLSAASTTLAQGGQYDPSSKGAIARQGGTVGAGLGSGLEGSGKGTSGSGADLDGAAGFAVEGGLDRETVRRVIAAYRNQIRACYERALLMQAKIEGRITYQWTISSQGPVLTAEVLSSTIAMPPLELCVLDVIKSMKFPAAPNGKGTRVKYPFVFQGFR